MGNRCKVVKMSRYFIWDTWKKNYITLDWGTYFWNGTKEEAIAFCNEINGYEDKQKEFEASKIYARGLNAGRPRKYHWD